MIDPALLDRLQKADQATYERFVEGMPVKPLGHCVIYDNGEVLERPYHVAYIPSVDLLPKVAEAWLQHVLQDAIRANGWGYTQISHAVFETGSRYICQIRKTAKGVYGIGDTGNDALLRAYLAAIEAA